MAMAIGRRTLLGTALAGTALAGTPAMAGAGRAPTPEAALTERLRGLLVRRSSAARVGRAFLEAVPGETDPGLLARTLAAGWPGGPASLAALPDAELARVVSERSRRDFAEGETVVLDGWLLSRTELRLCALAVLPA